MSKGFSPYRDWFNIADPVHYYSLLGLPLFEGDPAKVLAAGNARRAIVQQRFAEAPDEAVRLLAEISAAETCLLDPRRRSHYNAGLRSVEGEAAYDPMLPPGVGAGPPRQTPTNVSSAASPAASDSTSASIEINLSENGGLPPALRPSDFHSSPPGLPPAAAASPPMALPAGAPMALPVGPPAIPMALPVDVPLPPAVSAPPLAMAIPTTAPGGYQPAAIPLAEAVPFDAGSFAGDLPMATALPATPMAEASPGALPPSEVAPLAMALSTPIDTPLANASLAGAPLATPLTPSDFSAPSPHADIDAARSPAGGPAAPVRRTSSGNLLVLAGVPAALLIAAGLLLMYVTETGPFRPKSEKVASSTPGTSGSTTPAKSGTTPGGDGRNPAVPQAGSNPGDTPEPTTNSGDKPMPDPMAGTPTETPKPPPPDTPSVPTETPKPPSDTPKPPADPPSDPKVDKAVAEALMAVRFYLAHRDLEAAKAQLESARKIAAPRHAAELDRVGRLHHYVAEFWRAVAESIKMLDGGDQITIAGITLGIVETGPDLLIVRQNGRNRTYRMEDMPRGLAHGLAERWLNKDEAASPLLMAAFHTVNPTSEPAEARQLYERAAAAGLRADVDVLLPELDVKIPDDLASLPPPNAKRPAPGDTQPLPDQRTKVPAAEELTPVQSALQEQYKAELEAANSPAERVALAEKFDTASRAAGADAVTRYALYLAAREQLVAAQEAELACKLADTVAESFAVDAFSLKAQALADVAKGAESPESNKKLAELGLLIADEALLTQRYPAALRILRTAQAAARKAKDAELIKEVSTRLSDAQLQAKSGG
ncbi:MAG: hypothetical protein HYS13_20315 [Planctomycetia bacterium]|nr:hypothetical protein [Planctomycetia bacterium]